MKYMAQVCIERSEQVGKESKDLILEARKVVVDMLEYGIGDLTDRKVEFEVSSNFDYDIIVRAYLK